MSPNRKAELQRKLAMAPIPKPPAGLADRIKSEIPKHLLVDTEKERRRLSQAVYFNMRVAASILLLISSVYLALHVLSRSESRHEMAAPVAAKEKAAAQIAAAQPAASAPAPKPAAPQLAAAREQERQAAAPRERDEANDRVIVAEGKTEQLAAEPRRDAAAAGGAAPPATTAPTAVAQAAPPAPMPPPAAPAPAPEEYGYATVSKSSVVAEARAADLNLAPSTLFGVSLKSAVQQFAAPPSTPPRVQLDVEATTIDDRPTLRISIDTPERSHPAGGSNPPAAADARLEIAFNPETVASQRPLIGPIASSAPALPSSESVTALYGLELKPDLGRRDVIATVRLKYRDVSSGKQRVIERTIRVSDVRTWEHASRRTKGAILAEAVTSKQLPIDDIIARANAAGLSDVAAYAQQQKR